MQTGSLTYPKETTGGTDLLFINFGEKEINYCLPIAQKARMAGISTEIFADAVKMKKQMNYANALGVKYVAMVGEDEINQGKINLKNMETGEQVMLTSDELIEKLRK